MLVLSSIPLFFVNASDTGFKSPSATGAASNDWTDPADAYSSNDEYASAYGDSLYQDYYSFTFGVPAGATIDGIVVDIEGYSSTGEGFQVDVDLSGDTGSSWSPSKPFIFYDTEDIVEQGASDDLWDCSWSADNFSNDYFMLRMLSSMKDNTVYIDHIQVKVYYTEAVSNTPPVITASSENPSNESTLVGLYLNGNHSCFNISVTDVDANDMNITWSTNASGQWLTMGTNSSVSNGTYRCYDIYCIDEYNTTYWWNVSVNDGHGGWDNATFSFTTNNTLPYVDYEFPSDNDNNIEKTPTAMVVVRCDPDKTMNVSFYTNASGSWTHIQTNHTVSDEGNATCLLSGVNQYNKEYFWNVTVNDGSNNITHSFNFSTISTASRSTHTFTEFNGQNSLLSAKGVVWANVVNAVAGANPNFDTVIIENIAGSTKTCGRGFLVYNTSNIPDNAVITKANLSFPTASLAGAAGNMYFQDSNSGSSITREDYNKANFGSLYGIHYYAGTTTAFNVSLNQNLSISINKTGFTTIVGRFTNDYNIVEPTVTGGARFANEQLIKLYVDYELEGIPSNVEGTELPTNGSTGVNLTPTLTINVSDTTGSLMNQTFWTNATTGIWRIIFWNNNTNNATLSNETSGIFSAYNTKYWWNSSVVNEYGTWDNDTYTFTTEGLYSTSWYSRSFGGIVEVTTTAPDAPVLTGATASSDTKMLITWTDDATGADSTYIEWDSVNDTSWNRGNHNDTGINTSSGSEYHIGLTQGTKYYYKAWSWNSTNNIWSSGSEVIDGTTKSSTWHNASFGGNVTVEPSSDTTPPTIIINFAGNLSDYGGPYWRPPDETTALAGVFSDGYYTNDSRQQEDWMYINITVNDTESAVTDVWLQWLNGTTWTNWSYSFINTNGDYWEFNTSGNITTDKDYDYSFNVIANSTGGSNYTWWNKTAVGGNYTRRYIQLGCSPSSIEYTPIYLKGIIGGSIVDNYKKDRFGHDQGRATSTDTGIMNLNIPLDTVLSAYCGSWIGYWFDESICISGITLTNVYYHIWWADDDNFIKFIYTKSRDNMQYITNENKTIDSTENHSFINYAGTYHSIFNLSTTLMTIPPTHILTDNNIYETSVRFGELSQTEYPEVISNRSFNSFVLFNVPDNDTLNAENGGLGRDSDSDGLNDTRELFITYTNPFLADTDNDGISDYWENESGSDPNNYAESYNITAIDCELNTTTWIIGELSVGNSVRKDFKLWQNGSANIDIEIGINNTNFTYVNYSVWDIGGFNQYCANFTINDWVSESNINVSPYNATLKSNMAPGELDFGVRIWMPKTMDAISKREDFEVILTVTEHT